MSICLSGHERIDPCYNQTIDNNTKRQRNEIVHVSGVLFERVKEDAIQRKRKERTKEKIGNKNNLFKSLRKSFMKRTQDSSRFFDVPTYQNNEKIEHGKIMDNVIHCVDSAHAQSASVDISCRDEKFTLVQLQDQDDVHRHKKHRSKDNWKDEDCQSLEKVRSI